jgi:hypothetical protein
VRLDHPVEEAEDDGFEAGIDVSRDDPDELILDRDAVGAPW